MSNCKGCTEREIGCHAKCDSYNDFLRINEERKKFLSAQREVLRVYQDSFWRMRGKVANG